MNNGVVHTKEVEIGGEKFLAEYYEYKPNFICDSICTQSNQNKLSKMWDKISTLFHRIKFKTRGICWNICYGFERMFKGYDEVDVFEMFDSFIERYQKILTKYKEGLCCCPIGISEEEWKDIVDKMLWHLYFMKEENIDMEMDADVPENWIPTQKTISEIRERHKDKFFELFSKYFYCLWD